MRKKKWVQQIGLRIGKLEGREEESTLELDSWWKFKLVTCELLEKEKRNSYILDRGEGSEELIE